MHLFKPDKFYSRISHIDIERDLVACGLTNVLLDIDNTILTRDTRELPPDVGIWLDRAREAGISFCMVSNSLQDDEMQRLSEWLGIPVVIRTYKPLPMGYVWGKRVLGSTRKNTVMIGDQMITDVLGANLNGMKVYMVAPLAVNELPHTAIFRWMEDVLLGEQVPEPISPAAQEILDEASRA